MAAYRTCNDIFRVGSEAIACVFLWWCEKQISRIERGFVGAALSVGYGRIP